MTYFVEHSGINQKNNKYITLAKLECQLHVLTSKKQKDIIKEKWECKKISRHIISAREKTKERKICK